MKEHVKEGFVYYVLSTLMMAFQLYLYMAGSAQQGYMDFLGNCFYLAAVLSQAALFALVPYLVSMLAMLVGRSRRVANVLHVVLASLICVAIYIDSYVYTFYRFHINGVVLDLFLGPGAGQVFQFDAVLYLKVVAVILAIVGFNILFRKLSRMYVGRRARVYFWPVFSVVVVLALFANLTHAYAVVAARQSVTRSASFIPYYYPLTATRLMTKLGVVSQDYLVNADFGSQAGFRYPLRDVERDSLLATGQNIVIIGIDSWNFRSFTPEVMPYLSNYALSNKFFANHLSSSNGTRGSIFGMFFGVSSYYWKDFEMSGTTPVLLDVMQDYGYQIQVFPSATFRSPNFAKVIFRKSDVNTDTEGESVYDRDCRISHDFMDFLQSRDTCKPFFSFLFYDLPHSFEFPKELDKKFTPSWDFADYLKLSNDMDPTPFWNLYLSYVNAVDSVVGLVIDDLESRNLLSNSCIIITGDHDQEVNENHKNIWGHGGDFAYPQIHVPLIVHNPGADPVVYNHRTTHYDISATLLGDVLGVTNNPRDFGMGLNLSDTTFRDWHVVGTAENFAFVLRDTIIIEKHYDDSMDITDGKLDPIPGYKINPVELNNAIGRLNMFYNAE